MRKSNGKGPTSKQRLLVWQTSGGLTKADLTKNKRGKIVSRRKSHQASHTNNLGDWLRESGVSVGKGEMLRRKGSPPEGLKTEKQEGAQAPAKAQALAQKAQKQEGRRQAQAQESCGQTQAGAPQTQASPETSPEESCRQTKARSQA